MSAAPSLRERFTTMVAELRAEPYIELLTVELRPPATTDDLVAAAEALEGDLPAGLEALYRELDGMQLEWRVAEQFAVGGGPDRGMIDILPVRELAKDWKGVTWFDDDERFRGVRPFDFFVEEACGALVDGECGGLRDTVHYHYLGELLCDTGLRIDEYVDRLLMARGFWYWIESLCADTRESPEAQRFVERMPLLFEDFELALFRPPS